MALKPDYLLITGDFVDSRLDDLDALCNILRPLTAKVPTLGVTGNHDFASQERPATSSKSSAPRFPPPASACSATTSISPPAAPASSASPASKTSGPASSSPRPSPAPRDAAVIALAHNPDSYECLDVYPFDLMLSGHTHGGQVRIPGIGPIFVPVVHRERSQGLFHLTPERPHRALYVNRGIGHLLQIRLFCPPEVTCFTLQPTA